VPSWALLTDKPLATNIDATNNPTVANKKMRFTAPLLSYTID
jgi:hypothetical protein